MKQTRNTRTDERNEAIRTEFETLTKKRHLRTNSVLERLADKHFLTVGTIEKIVYRIGEYKDKPEPKGGDQLSMF